VYWARRNFMWFVKPYSRAHREGCSCDTCCGWRFAVLRVATLTSDSGLTDRSLLESHLCPRVPLVFGGGPENGGTEAKVFQNACLRGTCEDCRLDDWTAGLDARQRCEPCSINTFVPVVEGTDKKGKEKKRIRERRRQFTGLQLELFTRKLMPGYCSHIRDVKLCFHGNRELMRHGYAAWVDYAARMCVSSPDPLSLPADPGLVCSTIANLYHPQSGEMCPQELGAFVMVAIRPHGSKPTDNADTICVEPGRVMEYHVVIFDYNAGGGERAINTQSSGTTEACLALIMINERDMGLDMSKCGDKETLISDNCCPDLKCADHMGALDTWVNPDATASPQDVLRMKKDLAIRNFVRAWGAAKHGKDHVDAVSLSPSFATPLGRETERRACSQVATYHRQEADRLNLNWTPGKDVPEGKVEGAAQLVAHMQSMRSGPGNMKRHRRAELTGWESAQKEASVNAVYYNHLTVEFWVRPKCL